MTALDQSKPPDRDVAAEILHWRHGLAYQFAKSFDAATGTKRRARNFVLGNASLIRAAFLAGRLRADVLEELGKIYEGLPALEAKPASFEDFRWQIAAQFEEANPGKKTSRRARGFVLNMNAGRLQSDFDGGRAPDETLAWLQSEFIALWERRAAKEAKAVADRRAAKVQKPVPALPAAKTAPEPSSTSPTKPKPLPQPPAGRTILHLPGRKAAPSRVVTVEVRKSRTVTAK
ncbi:MAG: hypothetical protein ACLP4V_16360 [Methylocella sp.]